MSLAGKLLHPIRLVPALMLMLALAPVVWAQTQPATIVGPSAPSGVDPASFQISDIRVDGLVRVQPQIIFGLLDVTAGDVMDIHSVRTVIRDLFASGYFNDVSVSRDGQELVINVVENPFINEIDIKGNKAVPTDNLLDGLKTSGLESGKSFRRSVLEGVKSELQRLYIAQGRYSVEVDATVDVLEANQVDLNLEIDEGVASKITEINVIGNRDFSDAELLATFELRPTTSNALSKRDRYAREKLQGDLETMEAYCQDRGYVNFQILNTQVTISEDKKEIYITINVDEGEVYEISGVSLVGELGGLDPELLQQLLIVEPDTVYSQALVTSSKDRILDALAEAGFSQSNVEFEPEIDEQGKSVHIRFFVDVGKRTYVRRVNIFGNTTTQDEVIRREVRQLEGGWISSSQMELSKLRLERLGLFKSVAMETIPVPGLDDQVDLNFTVEEQPSGSLSASIGYARGSGIILSGSIQENNIFGTGNTLNFSVDRSSYQRQFNFSFLDPYVTAAGISRRFDFYTRETNYNALNISTYNTTSFSGGVVFGFPIKETQRMQVGLSTDYTKITRAPTGEVEYQAFFDTEGNEHLNYKLDVSWISSALNRGLFPTNGQSQSISLEASTPGSDLNFFKVSYYGQYYKPISKSLIFRLKARLGYSGTYGSSIYVPFYESFFAGGFGSIRGYRTNSVGSRSTILSGATGATSVGNTIGGNLLTEGSIELIFNPPAINDGAQIRPAIYFDLGQVFNTKCPPASQYCLRPSVDDLRYSFGVGVTWLSPLGPLSFSYSVPLNAGPFDQVERFQFEIGGRLY